MFYIHSRTVNGVKQSVSSSEFVTNVALPEGKYSVTMTDLGTTGYYDNVVKVEVDIYYDNANGKFPNTNTDVKITVTGTTAIAIDQ